MKHSLYSFFGVLVASFMAFSPSALATEMESLDSDSQKALQETQDLLRDQKKLEKEGLTTPESRATHQRVKNSMGGKENTQETYDIAAEVFAVMVQETKGNPEAMQKLLEEYSRDPAAFYAKMPEAQKARIKALGNKLENQSPSGVGQKR